MIDRSIIQTCRHLVSLHSSRHWRIVELVQQKRVEYFSFLTHCYAPRPSGQMFIYYARSSKAIYFVISLTYQWRQAFRLSSITRSKHVILYGTRAVNLKRLLYSFILVIVIITKFVSQLSWRNCPFTVVNYRAARFVQDLACFWRV